jgi:hypothetical protein
VGSNRGAAPDDGYSSEIAVIPKLKAGEIMKSVRIEVKGV